MARFDYGYLVWIASVLSYQKRGLALSSLSLPSPSVSQDRAAPEARFPRKHLLVNSVNKNIAPGARPLLSPKGPYWRHQVLANPRSRAQEKGPRVTFYLLPTPRAIKGALAPSIAGKDHTLALVTAEQASGTSIG